MKRVYLFMLMSILLLAVAGWAQQTNNNVTFGQANSQQYQLSGGGTLYDNFSTRWLNPSNWLPIAACAPNPNQDSADTFTILECVREVENSALHLKVKSWGDSSSNEGRHYGNSELDFRNPNAVRSIKTTLKVQSTHADACPANANFSTSQAFILGTFFNTGSGDPADDVNLVFLFERKPINLDPPNTVHGLALLSTASFSNFYGYYDFGVFPIDETIVAKVKWDQPNHQFIVSAKTENGSKIQAALPYAASDVTPAASPLKRLGAQVFVLNCMGQVTSGDMDAYFDNVIVNE